MGKIRAAKLENSPRLKRVLALLQDGGWHGTREIVRVADVCAVNTAMAELRKNDVTYECRCVGSGRYEYRLLPRPGEAQTSLF
ncbi:MAG: hypothetical protein IH614_13745 [Desulfuromonadales bacterium]|nr:hypothetical protein [Desulfuromonadales bacterium]